MDANRSTVDRIRNRSAIRYYVGSIGRALTPAFWAAIGACTNDTHGFVNQKGSLRREVSLSLGRVRNKGGDEPSCIPASITRRNI